MKPENAIEVSNLHKSFKIYIDKGNQLKERFLFRKRNKYEKRTVLDGISFEVKKGEAVALIGHNGCGKSTTLKLLTKIIYPDQGAIEMKGRVSSLIELGAGFHPDLSGRENIYTNAAIFGLNKKEINSRIQDIIDFSELEEFIDNPVRTYSSGMYMRLAFSVAINVDADILLIDEILAVGDASFQNKCFNKLRNIKSKGTTIVIVSHSLGQVEQICDRSIWIDKGKIRKSGKPRDVHPEYMDYMGRINDTETAVQGERNNKTEVKTESVSTDVNNADEANVSSEQTEFHKSQASENEAVSETDNNSVSEKKRWGNHKAFITGVRLVDESDCERKRFRVGETFRIEVSYNVKSFVEDAVFGIGIFRNDGLNCYGTNTRIDHLPGFDLNNNGLFNIVLNEVNFLPGTYTMDIAIEQGNGIPVDYCREIICFELYSNENEVGIARVDHEWSGDELRPE